MSAPRCVACGAPPWFGELLLYGTEEWARARLAEMGVPADRVAHAVADEREGLRLAEEELGMTDNPRRVNRWDFVICEACWPADEAPWTSGHYCNRWEGGIELFQFPHDRAGRLTAGQLAGWLAQQDPTAELVFAFRSETGVLWRDSSELQFELFADPWFDPNGETERPVIEIDVTGELTVESFQ